MSAHPVLAKLIGVAAIVVICAVTLYLFTYEDDR